LGGKKPKWAAQEKNTGGEGELATEKGMLTGKTVFSEPKAPQRSGREYQFEEKGSNFQAGGVCNGWE